MFEMPAIIIIMTSLVLSKSQIVSNFMGNFVDRVFLLDRVQSLLLMLSSHLTISQMPFTHFDTMINEYIQIWIVDAEGLNSLCVSAA